MLRSRSLPGPIARRRLAGLAAVSCATVALAAVPSARAAGETLSMVQNDSAAVTGRATNFTASGALNPADTMFGFDIFIFLKDADADPTCAADFSSESATALHSGGNESWVSPATGFEVGVGPAFSQPFKITFTSAGRYLLCGYVQGDFSTFAAGELRGTVVSGSNAGAPPVTTTTPAPATPSTPTTPAAAAVPTVVRAPWITRKGHVLTCHAGGWANGPTSLRYGWYRKGHRSKLGAGRRLSVHRALRGRRVVCRVTARNAAGSSSVDSPALLAR